MASKSAALEKESTPPTGSSEETANLLKAMDQIMSRLEKRREFAKGHRDYAQKLEQYSRGVAPATKKR